MRVRVELKADWFTECIDSEGDDPFPDSVRSFRSAIIVVPNLARVVDFDPIEAVRLLDWRSGDDDNMSGIPWLLT